MSSIKVNTELLKNNNDTLDSIKKYYSDKKSSFSSGNFNGNSTINNYLNKIQSSYSEIANNINEVSKYLKDYYEDIENMENIMSGNGGSVKAEGVNGIINGKASTLNKFSIEDGIIFEIIEFSTEGYKASINTESTTNNGENSSSSQEKINQTNTPTLESVVADQIGSGGMVFDFISGDFVPTGASVTSANYSLEAYDELANLYSEMGFSDSEVEELMACLNDEEAFMNKILEIENRKLSDPEQRRVIYENNILADYAEFFQTTYGEEFSSLEELKAAIERENLKIEELKGKQQANLFTSDVLSTLLSRSNEAVKSLTGDTTVVWAFLGDDGLVHYSFMDPSQFMVVSNGVMENANLDEFKGKNMYNPKAYTLDEILSMCDSDVAASFRSLLAGNEINEDAKNEVITKLSSIQDDILKEVEKRNTYQQIYDEVTSTIDYQLNYIDEYTYNEDFANNIEVSPEAIDKVKEVINGLINSSQIDGVSGEKYIEMSSNDIDGISTLLYAYYNDLGNVTYDGSFFYINGTRINTLNFNLTAMDFAKYKPYMNESEKEVLNYIYNTEGEEALFEWLKNIGNEVDSRYLSAEEAKDEAFAQEHNILGTIASFDYSDAIVGTLKSIWATVTNQGIKDSYTYDSSSTYRNVVGSCLGDKYGSWATKAFNIGTTAFDQLIWAPVHVLSGGTTAALPAMFLASRSVCSAIGEAKARGFSDWESLVSGGAKGLITFLTEHASASHLFKLDKIAEEKIAPFLYEAFGDHKVLGKTIGTAFALNSQALFEVEEEELEEILGNIVDEGLSHVFGLPSQSELDYQALLDIYPPEVAKTKYREAELNKYWDIAVDTYLSTLLSTGGYMGLNTAYENSNRHDAKKLASIIEDVRTNALNNQTQTVQNDNPGLTLGDTLLDKVKSYYDANLSAAEQLFGNKDTIKLDGVEQVQVISIENRLIEAIGDSTSYESIIKEIKTYNDNNLPDGYTSTQELHEKIVNKLLETGKFDTLTGREIAFLIEDNYDIVEMLVNNDRFKKFVIDNLEALPGFYAKHFKSLSVEQLQAVFDNPQMAEFINSLSNEKFIKILSAFTGKDCQILCTDTFREKFLSIPFADLASLNYTSNNLYNFIKQCKDANDTGFINDLISKIETEGLNEGNLGYCYNLLRILPVYGNFEIFKDVVKNKYLPEVRNTLKEALVKSSSVEIPDSFSEDGWYDITYIVDGKENVKSFNYSTKYPQEIIDYFYNYDEIASGKVNITAITKNNIKTNLDLHNIPNNGLNVITLEVDGQIEKIVDKVIGGNLSLASKFNGRDVKDVKVVSIEPFSNPTYNFNASSENAIYKVSYKLDDTMHVVYFSSEKLFTSAPHGEVGLDYYIISNNLYNISDVQIEELKVTKEMQDSLDIKRFKDSEEVFNSQEFGGRQNNIEDYIVAYLAGKEQSSIITKKCEKLISIIKKYYPNATDTEIKNIVKSCASSGCAFMAMANSFITYMNGLPNGEELFREKMGYDLYTQDGNNKSFNTELLALDLFMDGNISVNKESSIDDFVKNASGISNMLYKFIAEDFFAKRGIKATPEIINATANTMTTKLVQGYLNDSNNFLILCAQDFDLQNLSSTTGELTSDGALANAKIEGNITKGVGNHAMSVVEVLDDGSIIVSSWGKKYKFIPTENTSSTNVYTLKFELEG